jgi:hypothetical protein
MLHRGSSKLLNAQPHLPANRSPYPVGESKEVATSEARGAHQQREAMVAAPAAAHSPSGIARTRVADATAGPGDPPVARRPSVLRPEVGLACRRILSGSLQKLQAILISARPPRFFNRVPGTLDHAGL